TDDCTDVLAGIAIRNPPHAELPKPPQNGQACQRARMLRVRLIDPLGLCAQIARQRQQSTRGGSAMPCDGNCHHNLCTCLRHSAAALASAASGQRGNINMRPSRRAALGMLAAAGAGAALGARRAFAQGPAPAAGKDWIIDTHHHIYPPRYTNANLQRLLADTSVLGAAAYTGWSPRLALEQMDKAGVRSAVVSMTSPGVWWGNDEEGRTWARECNEFGAGMAKDFPGRFGMFAAIPLPDTEGSLREIAYALDTLKLDGIGLLTSYAGKPLGDPSFAPVFDELNRRKVALFVHPTMSCCGMKIPNVDAPTIDFPNDTTKTLMSLANSGTFARCPDIKFIFSHGGGTMPMIVQRLVGAMRNLPPEQRAKVAPRARG